MYKWSSKIRTSACFGSTYTKIGKIKTGLEIENWEGPALKCFESWDKQHDFRCVVSHETTGQNASGVWAALQNVNKDVLLWDGCMRGSEHPLSKATSTTAKSCHHYP